MGYLFALFVLEIALIAILRLAAGKRYADLMREGRRWASPAFLAPVSLLLMDRLKFFDRYPGAVAGIHRRLAVLYGSRQAAPFSKMYVSQIVAYAIALMAICTGLGAVSGDDPLFLGYGLVLAAFLPFLRVRSLDREMMRRKRQMLYALPEYLNKLILLVNAGETVQRALVRCTEGDGAADGGNPLKKELQTAAAQLENNYPFPRALEELSKRCGVQEVTMFTTTVLLNYRRGGDDVVLALRSLSHELWEKRKAMARTLGEEASSKLVFPMMLIFLVVMTIVAAPAILMMSY